MTPSTPLRVLIVEDNPDDAALVLRELRKAGFAPENACVQTSEDLRESLEEDWEVVLSDYSLPRLDALDALRIVRERRPDMPFIIVSGTIGEETAVEAMRAGANDYLMKDKLARLGVAVQRELEEARTRRARRQAEADLERQAQGIAGLRAINLAITASLDLGVTLSVILDHAASRLGVDAADILLLRPDSRELEFAAGRGFRTPALRNTRLPLGEGLAGQAAVKRESVMLEDLRPRPGGFGRSLHFDQEGFVAYLGIPLISKGQVRGVLELFHRERLERDSSWLDFAETLAGQAAVAIDNALMFEQLQRTNEELRRAYDETLEGWSRALDLRDEETEGHTRRVTEMTLRLCRALGMSDSELVHVRRGALLHDIGKMAIPDGILRKPGPLTPAERKVMERHPTYAFELLAPIAHLRPALEIPYNHHERWDGSGYPRGLAGETIPKAARAFAVVDVWDALRSDRPYRSAWPEWKVREYLRSEAGKHFDPEMVRVFLEHVLPEGEGTPSSGDFTTGQERRSPDADTNRSGLVRGRS